MQKAKYEIKELKQDLERKTAEIEQLENQTKEMRQQLRAIFEDVSDQEG